MRFFEITVFKPKSPQQQRIAALKRTADTARAALQREREAQRVQKAHKRLHDIASQKNLP
jgi:hypothetical protein